MLSRLVFLGLVLSPLGSFGALPAFLEKNCVECHDADAKKGGLDLTALKSDLTDAKSFETWVKIFDRTANGEMPPKKKARPDATQKSAYLGDLSVLLFRQDASRIASQGRTVERRMNRFEYENAVRDLLQAPWLDLKEILPEDTEAFRFNKTGQALDVSHVQLQRYLTAAEEGLRSAFISSVEKPDGSTKRHYARQQGSYTGKMKFSEFNQSPERATFPTLGFTGQPDVRRGDTKISVGKSNPKLRDEEGVGVVHGAYEPVEPSFSTFQAPADGRYKLKLCGHSVWVGPGKPTGKGPTRWYIPDLDDISKGHRPEPVTVYALMHPRILRRIGNVDFNPDVTVNELDVVLKAGETIRIDTVRFYRSRPGASRAQNPLATPEGQPGLVMRWIEVEGPIAPKWPAAPYAVLFDDLPAKRAVGSPLRYDVETNDAPKDAERLLRRFVKQAYRTPVSAQEEVRFLPLILGAMKSGSTFAEAMLTGYTAVLCSPSYLYLQEKPGRLDDYALAARLAYFLWNSPPDAQLRSLAAAGTLHL